MGMTLRVVIADEEALERQRLVHLLQAQQVDVVAACADGESALTAVRQHAPDVVFLEVQLPRLDGFEVLAALGGERPPAVIFVTAHPQYAVRAFEVHALDYLLKPVDPERLRRALHWAASLGQQPRGIAAGAGGGRVVALLEELTARERARGRDRLVIRTPERAFFLRTDGIDWVEAAGKFVRIHAAKSTHTVRQSMAELEQQLDSARFVRISRSVIVNLDRIQEIQPWFQGDYVLILADGTRLTSTRGYRESMRRLLGKSA
jgi:two-component system LytT family response regulator